MERGQRNVEEVRVSAGVLFKGGPRHGCIDKLPVELGLPKQWDAVDGTRLLSVSRYRLTQDDQGHLYYEFEGYLDVGEQE
jgi:hypothetical protein